MRQQERRRTPYPLTWEPGVAALLLVGLGLVLGVHTGRAAALLAAGAGWQWPEPAHLFRTVPAVLAGDASAGLSQAVPGVAGLGWWIAAADLAILTLLTIAAVWLLRHHGPQRLRGAATPAECEALLGRSRLWRNRRIIRPDLYPPGHSSDSRQPAPFLVTRLTATRTKQTGTHFDGRRLP